MPSKHKKITKVPSDFKNFEKCSDRSTVGWSISVLDGPTVRQSTINIFSTAPKISYSQIHPKICTIRSPLKFVQIKMLISVKTHCQLSLSICIGTCMRKLDNTENWIYILRHGNSFNKYVYKYKFDFKFESKYK